MRQTGPDFIGTTEAARILGKSNRTVHRMVTNGQLCPVVTAPGGFAGTYLFHRRDVLRLAAQQRKTNRANSKAVS